MPCSQMISMNCWPPRAMAMSRPAMLPAVNALIRNKPSSNIGSAILLSMMQNTTSSATPPTSRPITVGLVQPMAWP